MKQSLAAIFLFCIFTALSCTKDKEASLDQLSEVAMETFHSGSAEEQKQMYSAMTAEEKYNIWIDHLTAMQGRFSGNSQQEALILQLKGKLSPGVFTDDSHDQIVFMNYYTPQWMGYAKQVFNDKEIYDLVFENKNLPYEESSTPDCFCHVGNSGYSCKKWSIGFPSGVTVEYGMCENAYACNYSRRGCGFLWVESCNGSHCNY
jgi:hypothetical protein